MIRDGDHAARGCRGMAYLVLGRIEDWSSEVMAQQHISVELLAQAPTLVARRQAWLAGRVLLSRLLGDGPLPLLPLSSLGKPLSAGPRMPAFNISHSGGYIAVLAGPNTQPVGCDIELVRPRCQQASIAGAYFSRDEQTWLASLPDEGARQAGFFKLWTLREAMLKQKGASVWNMADMALHPDPPYSADFSLHHRQWQNLSVACCLAAPAKLGFELLL